MSEAEKAEVRSHIALYKKIRPTMQLGRFYRLLTPFAGKGNETAWEFVSRDGQEVVLLYFKTLATPATELRTLKLQALDAAAEYDVAAYYPAQGLDVYKRQVYFIMDIFYSAKDVAIWSMIPALSFDSHERDITATIARIGSVFGANLVTVIVMPVVLYFSLNQNGGACLLYTSWPRA